MDFEDGYQLIGTAFIYECLYCLSGIFLPLFAVCEDEAEEADVTLSLALTLLNGDVADANVITDSEWDFDCRYDTSSYDNGRGIVPAYLLAPYVETSASLK